MSEEPKEPYAVPSQAWPAPTVLAMKTDALAWADVHNLIVRAILANEGRQFHNHDQGHYTYRKGAESGSTDELCNDSPEQNGIFQLLTQTSAALGDLVPRRIETWQDFCRLAIEGYENNGGGGSS